MSAARAMGAQLLRPAIVLHELLLVVKVLFFLLIVNSVDAAERAEIEASFLGFVYLDLLLVAPPIYAGFLCGLGRMQALVCGYSWTAPGYRRSLDTAVCVIGPLFGLLCERLYAVSGGPVATVPAVLLASAWFAVGAFTISLPPFRARGLVWFSIVVVALLGAKPTRVAALAAPVVTSSVLGALVLGLSFTALRRRFHRESLVAPAFVLDASLAPPAGRAFGDSRPLKRAAAGSGTGARRPLATTAEYVRACIHEQFGRYRFGFLGRLAVSAAVVAFWLLAMIGLPVEAGSSWEGLWRAVHHVLVGPVEGIEAAVEAGARRPPGPWIEAAFLALWSGIFALTQRPGFLPGRFVPISRSELARIAFRTSLRTNGGALLAAGLYLSLLAGLAVVLGGRPVTGLPYYVRPLVLCAIGMPLLSRFVLWRVTPDASRKPRSYLVVDAVVVGALYTVGISITELIWRNAAESVSEWLPSGIAFGVLGLVWWHHRTALERWFRTADL